MNNHQAVRANAEQIRSAAARLGALLACSPDAGRRILLLRRLAKRLGPSGFPTLVKLLMTVGESGNHLARQATAETLEAALRRDALPCGVLPRWGASSAVDGNARGVGPIEYLVAWRHQPIDRAARLSRAALETGIQSLVGLFSTHTRGAALYTARLRTLAEGSDPGLLNAPARNTLLAIAQAWDAGGSASSVAAATRHSTPTSPDRMLIRPL